MQYLSRCWAPGTGGERIRDVGVLLTPRGRNTHDVQTVQSPPKVTADTGGQETASYAVTGLSIKDNARWRGYTSEYAINRGNAPNLQRAKTRLRVHARALEASSFGESHSGFIL